MFRSKTSPKQEENSADLSILHSYFVVKETGGVLCNFVNSTMKKASMGTSKPGAYSLISFSSVVSVFFSV